MFAVCHTGSVVKGVEGGSSIGRIEIESDAPSDPDLGADVPAPEPSSRGRSVVVLGLVALAIVGVTFFLIRPGDGLAGEGPLRGAAPVQEPPALTLPESTILRFTALDTPQPLTSIVRLDDGFIGNAGGEGTTPTILRSDDGDAWREVETAVTTLGTETDGERFWFDLQLANGRLQMRGQTIEDEQILTPQDIFISNDGVLWEQIDGIGSAGGQRRGESLITQNTDGQFTLGIGSEELVSRFLEEHTTLQELDFPACDLDRQGGGDEPVFVVGDCAGADLVRDVGASFFDSAVGDEELLDCMFALSEIGPGRALVHQPSDGERMILGRVNFFEFPFVLADGGFSLVDIGGFGEGTSLRDDRCDGIVDISSEPEPSVVVVDGATNELRRWPLPDPEFGSGSVSLATVVGEFSAADGGAQLLVSYDQALWSLDRSIGSWTILQRVTEELPIGRSPIFGGAALRSSATSDLLYGVTGEQLIIVDPVANDVGEPISLSLEPPTLRREIDGIVYVDDESVFVQTARRVWRIPLR